jgi:hypothetical protein
VTDLKSLSIDLWPGTRPFVVAEYADGTSRTVNIDDADVETVLAAVLAEAGKGTTLTGGTSS